MAGDVQYRYFVRVEATNKITGSFDGISAILSNPTCGCDLDMISIYTSLVGELAKQKGYKADDYNNGEVTVIVPLNPCSHNHSAR